MRVYNLRHVVKNHFSFLFCLGAHIFSIRQYGSSTMLTSVFIAIPIILHTHTQESKLPLCVLAGTRGVGEEGGKSGSNCGPTLLSFPCTANFLVIFSICVASLNTHNLYIVDASQILSCLTAPG